MAPSAPAWLHSLFGTIAAQAEGSSARRAAFVCWICVPLYLLFAFWALGGWFIAVTDPTLDGRVLSYATLYGFVMTAAWLAAAVYGLQLDHLHKPDLLYTRLVLAGYAGSTALTCYLVGTLNIMCGLAMMGAPLLGMMLFPLQRILVVFVVATLLVLGASVASAVGLLPYAPVLSAGLSSEQAPSLYYALSGTIGAALYTTYEVVIMAALVSAARSRQQHVLTLAVTDPLTGLANRKHILDELARLTLSRDMEKPVLSVVLIDLDRFQRINELHGFRASDRALCTVAQALRHCLRSHDLIGRVHGEEFLVILPDTGETAAREVAERCRHAVRGTVLELDGQRVDLTACVGIASCDGGGSSVDTLLQRAHQAVQAARETGRDRVMAA